jgi:hypothetical protein
MGGDCKRRVRARERERERERKVEEDGIKSG